MTDREKLIELLSENLVEYCNVDIIAGHCKIRAITFDVDKFADHLLANGVRLESNQATSDKTSDKTSEEQPAEIDFDYAAEDDNG